MAQEENCLDTDTNTKDYLEAYALTVPASQQRRVNMLKLSLKNSFPFYMLETDEQRGHPTQAMSTKSRLKSRCCIIAYILIICIFI